VILSSAGLAEAMKNAEMMVADLQRTETSNIEHRTLNFECRDKGKKIEILFVNGLTVTFDTPGAICGAVGTPRPTFGVFNDVAKTLRPTLRVVNQGAKATHPTFSGSRGRSPHQLVIEDKFFGIEEGPEDVIEDLFLV
jgi:hypothetical protein